ncbi:hypothetical protein WDU94_005491 [Cyamophila willieti]
MARIQTILQSSLDSLSQWAAVSGFSFAPLKCQAIHFCRKRKPHDHPSLHINDIPLTFHNNIRLLGVIFDNKLTFKSHLAQLKTDCLKRVNLMRLVSHLSWGSDRNTLLLLYRSFIRSKIDYACVTYSSAHDQKLKTLDTIHNQCLRLCIGAFRSSPIVSILSDSGEPPLSFRREMLCFNYLLNSRRDPRHIHYSILHDLTFFNRFVARYNVDVRDLEVFSTSPHMWPWLPVIVRVHKDMLKVDKKSDSQQKINIHFRETLEKFPNFQLLYTDASKMNMKVSAAFTSDESIFKVRLNPETCISNAELLSIFYAVSYITSQNQHLNFLICSDSLSAIHCLENPQNDNPIALNIRKLLFDNKDLFTIEFLWIPSHVGIPGNEKADQLAKEALSDNNIAYVNTITIEDKKNTLKKLILSSWNDLWNLQIGNKLLEIKSDTKPWAPPFEIKRRDQVSITRLRIGHTNITHSFLMKKEDPPICNRCRCQITVKHILNECPLYSTTRTSLHLDTDLFSCLKNNDVAPILTFLQLCNLKI